MSLPLILRCLQEIQQNFQKKKVQNKGVSGLTSSPPLLQPCMYGQCHPRSSVLQDLSLLIHVSALLNTFLIHSYLGTWMVLYSSYPPLWPVVFLFQSFKAAVRVAILVMCQGFMSLTSRRSQRLLVFVLTLASGTLSAGGGVPGDGSSERTSESVAAFDLLRSQ